MSEFKILELYEMLDARGRLSVIQDELPFTVRRVFWIVDADEKIRGGHRHHSTRQALIAVRGAISVYMNDGIHQQTIRLDSPSRCLIVEPEDWHTMHFESDSVLLVLASEKYDRNDYIDEHY
ncbi:FdtA/QdtA family cupin domain-containing protein [Chromobacterium violaceum]|uniref:sugar 3,4-ketoisomerase n=1 Tax=Chromobacterium violaceum TaxID=536 RepID=UPI0035A74530